MEKLPERWAVERTPENYKQVNEWANANLPCGPYFHEQGIVISDGYINCSLDNDEHELITDAQFMQLAYNPWKAKQNSDGWVKCSERLPERDTEKYIDRSTKKNVWVYEGGDRFDCTVGFYVHLLGYWVNEFGSRIEVTHWRELPARPKD